MPIFSYYQKDTLRYPLCKENFSHFFFRFDHILHDVIKKVLILAYQLEHPYSHSYSSEHPPFCDQFFVMLDIGNQYLLFQGTNFHNGVPETRSAQIMNLPRQ